MNRSLRRARERHLLPGPFDFAKPELMEKFLARVRSVRLRKRIERMFSFFDEQRAKEQRAETRQHPRRRSR
jgi:hypothetical protein